MFSGYNPFVSPFGYPGGGYFGGPQQSFDPFDDFEEALEPLGSDLLPWPQQQQQQQQRSRRGRRHRGGRNLTECAECQGTGKKNLNLQQGQQQQGLQQQSLQQQGLQKQGQQQLPIKRADQGAMTTQQGGGLLSLPQQFQQPLDVQVRDEDQRLVISASLQGVPHDKIDLSVENGFLTLSAQRAHQARDGQSAINFAESINRAILLPNGVDESQINANFKENGVLEVVVPKPSEARQQRQRINISTGPIQPISESLQQQGLPQQFQAEKAPLQEQVQQPAVPAGQTATA
jgi:HSP20 family molecular chaperone IbpA